jgi:TolA-binding protein
MLKKVIYIFTGLGSFLFLQGCFVTQSDIGVLKTQIAALNQTLQNVQRNQAAADQQMEDVTAQLTQSVDNLNNFDYKLDAISAKLDNISVQLESKNAVMLPSEIYAEAKTQFDAKKYSAASTGFALYVKNAPEGQHAEESYLYLAESLYNLKEYQKAAVSAATLLDKFPKSKYTPAARVLYAQSILPLGKKTEAANYLKSVVQDYKTSTEAAQAKKLIEGIK